MNSTAALTSTEYIDEIITEQGDFELLSFLNSWDRDYKNEIKKIDLFDVEVTARYSDKQREHFARTVLAEAYVNCDTKALRAELHRLRGGVCYLKLPQLEQALQSFHQAVKADPQDEKVLEITYVALQEAIDTFGQAWESDGI